MNMITIIFLCHKISLYNRIIRAMSCTIITLLTLKLQHFFVTTVGVACIYYVRAGMDGTRLGVTRCRYKQN